MNRILLTLFLASLFYQTILISQTLDATLLEINFSSESEPNNFHVVGDILYFTASNGTNGRELWMTDGSNNGTKMVKDIREGSLSAFDRTNYDVYTSIGNVLYFMAKDISNAKELWRTDGTESGTYMVKDEYPNGRSNTNRVKMVTHNNKVIYNFDSPEFGEELWISDGTSDGTHLLKDIYPGSRGSNPNSMFLFNDLVYFIANNDVDERQLWKTDGTEVGTQMLLSSNSSAYVEDSLVINGKFYFSDYNNNIGNELWSSDGTAAGTQVVKDINPGFGSAFNYLQGSVVGNLILFKATDGVHGDELWRTDGTETGTFMVKNINGISDGSIASDSPFVTFGDNIYFIANDGIHGKEIWKSDGTEAGTVMLKDISSNINSPYPIKLHSTNNHLYFILRNENTNEYDLWVSDGTEAGTQILREGEIGSFSMIDFNNKVYFSASTTLNGNELWETNGNPSNTKLFKDINASKSAEIASPRFIDDKLFFYALNSAVGREPFTSDGTVEGTKLISDIIPGSNGSNNPEYNSLDFAKAGENAVFFAKNENGGIELFKSDIDGTNASLLKNINGTATSSIPPFSFLITMNNEAYFQANDGIHGTELWKTDGTEDGTNMVKDITPGAESSIIDPFVFNNYLYFTINSSSSVQIMRTDGTAEGTEFVTSMPYIRILATSDDYIYFGSSNEYPVIYRTDKIWKLDVDNNEEIIENGELSIEVHFAGVLNDHLYFVSREEHTNNDVIYKTDGTPHTSEIVLSSDDNIYKFHRMIVCGEYLYVLKGFNNLSATEIWRTDGSPGSFRNIISASDHPDFQTALYFSCLQDARLLFNDTSNPVLYSVGENELTARFHEIEVANNNVDINYVFEILTNENQIMIIASAPGHGAELYSVEASTILNIIDFQNISNEDDKSLFKLYPNPIQNFVTIENILNYPIEKIELYNMSGQKLKEIKTKESNPKIIASLQDLSSGIYLFKVYSNSSTETIKVIKD